MFIQGGIIVRLDGRDRYLRASFNAPDPTRTSNKSSLVTHLATPRAVPSRSPKPMPGPEPDATTSSRNSPPHARSTRRLRLWQWNPETDQVLLSYSSGGLSLSPGEGVESSLRDFLLT